MKLLGSVLLGPLFLALLAAEAGCGRGVELTNRRSGEVEAAKAVSSLNALAAVDPSAATYKVSCAETTTRADEKNPKSLLRFDVQKTGCTCMEGTKFVTYKATGRGDVDDAKAIQMCLLAAGQQYEANGRSEPVEVYFPRGHYYVEGQWRTSQPFHHGYDPQWVVFSLPSGVHVVGENRVYSIISLVKKGGSGAITPETIPAKRRGTYLFHLGMEAVKAASHTNKKSATANYPTQSAAAYCDQPGVDGAPAPGVADPLCHSLYVGSNPPPGGIDNTFRDIALIGDRDGLMNDTFTAEDVAHWKSFGEMEYKVGRNKGHSCAIEVLHGARFNLDTVLIRDWYRGVLVSGTNGITVTNSVIRNFLKYGFGLWGIGTEGYPERAAKSVFRGNLFGQEESFLDAIVKHPEIVSWISMIGLHLAQGLTANNPDTEIINNSFVLTGRGIMMEEHDHLTRIGGNTFSRVALGIQIGGTDKFQGVLGHVEVYRNTFSKILTGVQVLGCDHRSDLGATRCALADYRKINGVDKPAVTIWENTMNDFLAATGTGSDPDVARFQPVAAGWRPAGIQIYSSHDVTIQDNTIAGLSSGTQLYGIGVTTSLFNTQEAKAGASCYAAINKNRDIRILRNRLTYSDALNGNDKGIGLPHGARNVGVYVENTDSLAYEAPLRFSAPTGQKLPNENRAFDSTLTSTHAFCTTCARRMENKATWMATERRAWLKKRPATDEFRLKWGYCADFRKDDDEEFKFWF